MMPWDYADVCLPANFCKAKRRRCWHRGRLRKLTGLRAWRDRVEAARTRLDQVRAFESLDVIVWVSEHASGVAVQIVSGRLFIGRDRRELTLSIYRHLRSVGKRD